jgi:hypothetical protein
MRRALLLTGIVALGVSSPDAQDAASEIHLPAFTFRTMDHQAVKVKVNGKELNSTPCLWSITGGIEFDPKIAVDKWPPEEARLVGTAQHPESPAFKAELYIGEGRRHAAKVKDLLPNDSVLYVKGMIGGREIQGAVRLRVDGYRSIDYTPLEDPDGEHARGFLRTIWFERTPDE